MNQATIHEYFFQSIENSFTDEELEIESDLDETDRCYVTVDSEFDSTGSTDGSQSALFRNRKAVISRMNKTPPHTIVKHRF